MSRTARLGVLAIAAATVLGGAVACGGNSGTPQYGNSTPTEVIPTTSDTPAATTGTSPFATAFSNPSEHGQAPVFYRTTDNFGSVIANQSYKVLFRVTNGYSQPTLTVTANCSSCPGSPLPMTFTGTKVTPVGADAPGSYYPVNVTLPNVGNWELTVQAGRDSVKIPLEVKPAP